MFAWGKRASSPKKLPGPASHQARSPSSSSFSPSSCFQSTCEHVQQYYFVSSLVIDCARLRSYYVFLRVDLHMCAKRQHRCANVLRQAYKQIGACVCMRGEESPRASAHLAIKAKLRNMAGVAPLSNCIPWSRITIAGCNIGRQRASERASERE